MSALMTRAAARRTVLLCAVAALGTFAAPAGADSTVLDNGTVQLGINDNGSVTVGGYDPAAFRITPGPVTGLRLLRGEQPPVEGIAGGCCEGWGVADAGSTLTGSTTRFGGAFGLELVSFTHDADSATSIMRTTGEGAPPPTESRSASLVDPPVLEVRQEFGPSQASRQLFEIAVTITNTGTTGATDLRYRRVVDWDVAPTPGDEVVSIDGTAFPNLLYSSDGGRDPADPLGRSSAGIAPQCGGSGGVCTGFFTDASAGDRGAHLDFGLGGLAAGASVTFTLFYGAAATEPEALAALQAAGADVWSLGQSSEGDGPTLGTPATFVLAMSRGDGAPTGPAPSLAMHAPALVPTAPDGSPAPFDVSADLRNFGSSAATGLSVDLELPAGLTLTSGDDPAALGDLAPGADATASWTVQPPDNCQDVTLSVGTTASWDGAAAPLHAARSILVRGSCSRVYGYLTGADRTGVRGLPGASVDLCQADLTGCTSTTTDAFGRYEFVDLGLPVGETSHEYKVVAHGSGAFTSPPDQTASITATRASIHRQDFGWQNIEPIAPGTTLSGPGLVGTGPVPTIYWNAPTILRKAACDPPVSPSSARYRVVSGDGFTDFVAWTAMARLADGSFEVTIPPLFPSHGGAHIEIEVTCGGDPPVVIGFDVYIDPSGFVRDQDGSPIEGATVTLYRYESVKRRYEPVPDGSAVMSPANRSNPDTTDAAGHFGWDVIAGNYSVVAEKAGCHAPSSTVDFVETGNLAIPPPVLDLDLRLECEKKTAAVGNPLTAGVTPISAPLAARGDTTAPVLTGLGVVPKRVRPVKLGRKSKATIVFKLSERASVRFSMSRILMRSRVGGRCPAGFTRTATRCKRFVFIRALTKRTRPAGKQSVAFGGLSSTRKLLRNGEYRLTAVPTDKAGNRGATKSTLFQVGR